MDRIVYISGVHGCGKSTLRKKLEKDPSFLLHNRPGHVKFEEVFPRQLWRLCRYNIEVLDQLKWEKANPGKVIIGDRCVYDNLMYNKTFEKIRWLEEDQARKLDKVFETLFEKELRPKNIVFLNPPLKDVKSWIIKRWEIEGKKWNEEDFSYLEELKSLYEDFYHNLKDTNLNFIEINTTNRDGQVNQVLNWIDKEKILQT